MYINTDDIKAWCYEHELHHACPKKQVMKIHEEIGELSEALLKHDRLSIIDAIGDVFIAHVVLSEQIDLEIEERVIDFDNHFYNTYDDVSSFMVEVLYPKIENLTFAVTMPNSYGKVVKDKHINDIIVALQFLARLIGLDFKTCVEEAYNEIKGRSKERVNRGVLTIDYNL